MTGPGDMGVAEQGAGLPRPLAGPAPLLQVHRVWISTQYLHNIYTISTQYLLSIYTISTHAASGSSPGPLEPALPDAGAARGGHPHAVEHLHQRQNCKLCK